MIDALRLLHELDGKSTRYSTTYYVRHLESYEPIPLRDCGIPDSPRCQKDWIWVAYSSTTDEPLAILVAAPMQGIAMLMRAYGTESAPSSVWVGILRKSLADMASRGYDRYGVFLNPKEKHASRLLSIARRAGAIVDEGEFKMVYGPTSINW